MQVDDEGSIWCGAGTLAAAGAALVLVAGLVLRRSAPGKAYWLFVLGLLAVTLLLIQLGQRPRGLASRTASKVTHAASLPNLAPWILVTLGPVLAATVTGFWTRPSPRAATTVALLVGVPLNWVVARQWSRLSLRIVASITVIAVLLLVGRLGQESVDSERLARARSHAQEANAELVTLGLNADAALAKESAKATRAIAAGRAIPLTAEMCASPAPGAADRSLCKSLGGLEQLARDLPPLGWVPRPAVVPVLPAPKSSDPADGRDSRAEERRMQLKTLAQARNAELDLPLRALTVVDQAVEQLASSLPTNAPEHDRAELVRNAVGAMKALLVAYRTRASLDTDLGSAAARVDFLCIAGGGDVRRPLGEVMKCTPSGQGETARELAIVDAEAKRAAADVARNASDDDASKARLTRADNDLSSALSDRQNPAKPEALTAVLAAGGNSLAQAVPGLNDPRVPVALTLVGWILVAALALAAYRRLEVANSKRGLGLVKIVGLAGSTDKEDLRGEFRRYLIANVAEPGAVPGAQALTTAAELLEAAPDPASKIIQSILKVIPAITAPQASYVVDVTYWAGDAQPPDPPVAAGAETAPTVAPGSAGSAERGPEHEVFVRITSAVGRSTVATHSTREATSHLALRAAGYWAAAWILERDRASPSWAAWSAESAPALAAYDETGDGDDTVGLHHLENCANLAPTSGLVLTRLAHAYDLKNKHVDALELYLRAVTRHPRYPVASYRVGLSLSLISARVQTDWLVMSPEGHDTRCRVLKSVERCGRRMNLDEEKLHKATDKLKDDATTPDEARTELCKAALLFLDGTTSLLNRRQVATNALRRSERRYWLSLLREFRQPKARSRLWDIANSAKLSVTYRGGLTRDSVGATYAADLLSYTKRAEKPKTSWQVVYNLACHNAIVAADPPSASSRYEAITLLEQVLERDGSGQLKQVWLDGDPDLESIREEGRFTAFRDKLNRRPEVGKDDDS